MLTKTSQRCRFSWKRDEQGSLIVAISIIMVIGAVLSVFAATVIGNQLVVVHRQHNQASIAAADAGLSDALFRVDQISSSAYLTGQPNPSFCVANDSCGGEPLAALQGSNPTAFASYTAAYSTSSDTWLIQSKAYVSGDTANTAAVQETLWRTAQFPYAIFGNTGLNFDGRSTGGLQTYATGATSTTAGPVKIGSNGTIYCNGGLPTNVSYWTWSGGGGVSSCSTATTSNTTLSPTIYKLPVQTAWPSDAVALPADSSSADSNDCALGTAGTTTSPFSGPGNVWDYYCTGNLTIYGSITIPSGKSVRIYLIPPPSDPAYTGNVFTINGNSLTVNGPAPSGVLPDPTQLQIYSDSQGTFGNSNGASNAFILGGIIDAPNATLTANGCQSTYYGSLVINTLTCNGSPNLSVNYDTSLSQMKGNWQSTGYRQIPPGTFNP